VSGLQGLRSRRIDDNSEIDQLVAARSLDDVARLDVPVHEPGVVHRRERPGDADPDLDDRGLVQPALLFQPHVEALPGDVLHHQSDHAARVVALEGIESHDVGVLHPAEGARLLEHPVAPDHCLGRGAHDRLGQEKQLDRDVAEPLTIVSLLGQPDRGESAVPELAQEPIRAERAVVLRASEQRMDLACFRRGGAGRGEAGRAHSGSTSPRSPWRFMAR
jgi:hypothetical protein